MGSKFFINYLRQKWCQIHDLYVAVNLYWECRYAGLSQCSCGLVGYQICQDYKLLI